MEKEYKHIEVGRINLKEGTDLRVGIVNDEELDLRIWMDTEKYQGPTKRGVRFNLFDDTWIQFKELMKKVDTKHKELL